jgi:hypothetical protein
MERLVVCSYCMIWISLLRHFDVVQEVNEEVVFPFMYFICENVERTFLKDMFGSTVA